MLGAIAAVTQFTKPGWMHIDSACGYLGGNRANGSYLALRAADRSAWSLIAETTTAAAEQFITVTIRGGLPSGTVHVWRTSPASADPADWLLRRTDIALDAAGSFTFGCLGAGYVYSFTTTSRQGIIRPSIPASQPFRSSPTPTAGPGTPRRPGRCRRTWRRRTAVSSSPAQPTAARSYVVAQTTPMQPIFWHPKSSHDTRFPYAVIGSSGMASNYKVSVSLCFTASGQSGGVIARFSSQGNEIFNFRGYILDLGSGGRLVAHQEQRERRHHRARTRHHSGGRNRDVDLPGHRRQRDNDHRLGKWPAGGNGHR